jgi:ElaB/YqjD/DUF883 family membrane-anchored ribosome-binding protein
MTATTPTPATGDVDALRADAQATRAELGQTVAALAQRADVNKRARDAARHVAAQARATAKLAARRVRAQARDKTARTRDSIRENPVAWSGAAAGLLAAAGAVVGVRAWQRSRRRPLSRAQRLWRAATSPVH